MPHACRAGAAGGGVSVYIANTTYGYGDTETVAYSERSSVSSPRASRRAR